MLVGWLVMAKVRQRNERQQSFPVEKVPLSDSELNFPKVFFRKGGGGSGGDIQNVSSFRRNLVWTRYQRDVGESSHLLNTFYL